MKLWTINRALRCIGLVLVVAIDADGPTRIWLELAKTYDERARRCVATPSILIEVAK